MFNRSDSPNAALRPTLGAMASAKSGDGLATAVANWPTPKSSDHRIGNPARYKGEQSMNGRRSNLNDAAARMWRTPSAMVTEPKNTVVKLTGRKPTDPQVGLADQVGGKLNPSWVEWLMGWPIGWTDLKLSATVKCRDVRQKRGACS